MRARPPAQALSACRATLLGAWLAASGAASAIDTLNAAPLQVAQAQTAPPGSPRNAPAAHTAPSMSNTPSPSPGAEAAAEDSAGAFQPLALALAGALLMGYIGLRRPQD